MNLQQFENLNNELMANLLEVCLNEKPCPLCSAVDMYTERVVVEIENNCEVKTETCECPCADGRRYLKHVQNQGLHGNYLRVRLPKMQPSRLCTLAPEKQKTLIAKVQKAPEEGWAFFGPPGTGKSMLTAALFKNALGCSGTNVRALAMALSGHTSSASPLASYVTRRRPRLWASTTKGLRW